MEDGCGPQEAISRLTAVLSFNLAKADYAAAKDKRVATRIRRSLPSWVPQVAIQGRICTPGPIAGIWHDRATLQDSAR
jgi:hypothetical protein